MKISLSPQEFLQVLLSHHPLCKCFDEDVILLLGHKICAGCLIGYPIAVLTFFLFARIGIEGILISISLAVLSQLRRFTANYCLKLFFRGVAGAALGFGLVGLLSAIQSQNLVATILIISAGIIYAVLRLRRISQKLQKHTCHS